LAASLGLSTGRAAEPLKEAPAAEGPVDFVRDIQPILIGKCYKCHGPEEQQGSLRLDLKAAAIAGGDSGPAWEAGQPAAESLLYQYVSGEGDSGVVMPPEEEQRPLSQQELALVKKWLNTGAHWPDGADTTVTDPAKATNHWAFQPVHRPTPPVVNDEGWGRTPIDAFVFAKLGEKGLSPSREASRLELVRRATYDLTGLPPSPEEVEQFLTDDSPQAYEHLLDRLLGSPRYGERWGRHWLDLARYADSDGFEFDEDRPLAYHYRDYVIRAFNEDKPLNRFIVEQLAGDELDPNDIDCLTATGFCRNGPTIDNQVLEKNRLDELDDNVATTGTVFLGLTIGCARCHNHRYEPITQRDYYTFLAIFNPSDKKNDRQRMYVQDAGSTPRPTHFLNRGDHQQKGEEVPPAAPAVLTAVSPLEFPTPAPEANSTGRRLALAKWIASNEHPLTARVLANRIWHYHFGRGIVSTPSNFGRSGDAPTHPELLDWLASELVAGGWQLKSLHKLIMTSSVYKQASGQDLAKQQADPANQWLWRYPLRRLSAEEIRDAILTSSGKLDLTMYGPGVKPRIHPSVIATGSTPKWPIVEKEGPEHWRRSVYVFVKRSVLLPLMEGFDAPTTTQTCEQRMTTTVPTQALQLLNNEFTNEHAVFMAERLEQDAGAELDAQIDRAWRLALSRPADEDERRDAAEFVRAQTAQHAAAATAVDEKERAARAQRLGLADLCHVLFNSNEFVYVP